MLLLQAASSTPHKLRYGTHARNLLQALATELTDSELELSGRLLEMAASEAPEADDNEPPPRTRDEMHVQAADAYAHFRRTVLLPRLEVNVCELTADGVGDGRVDELSKEQ
jgi:hypothetical protein